MSRYADFTCPDYKIYLFLGKTIFRNDGSVNYFHIGSAEEPLNWQRPELNQVIWKMFADYASHDLCIAVEGSDEYEQAAEFGMIGGDLAEDITEEEYLKDWDGLHGPQRGVEAMSRYANFACMDCKVSRFLGKAIFRKDESVNYFHIGGPEQPLNWQRPQLNQVIWKMFADHAGHHLRVLVSGDPDFDRLADFIEIGGTANRDISEEDYLKGWDGLREENTSS